MRTSGTVEDARFVFDNSSNVFMQGMKDVIGVRLVDYQIATIRGNVYTGGYVIDIQIDEIPTRAQILDTEMSRVFARIPLDRVASVSEADVITRDQSLKREYETSPRYFNPITLDRLTIHQTSLGGFARERIPLQSNSGWMMILEITTIDHEAPKPDKLARSIEKLCRRLDNLPDIILNPPPEPASKPVGKKIPFMYLVGALVAILGGWLYFMRSGPSQGVPQIPGLP